MKRGFKYGKVFFLLLLQTFFLTGCSEMMVNTDSDIYNRISSQTQTFTDGVRGSTQVGVDALIAYIKVFCHYSVPVAIVIIIISEIIGFVMLRLFGDDIGMRKKAIKSYIIGLPLAMLFISVFISYLAGVFFS